MARKCSLCGKLWFAGHKEAFSAAIRMSRKFGKPYRVVPCAKDPKRLHLSTQRR